MSDDRYLGSAQQFNDALLGYAVLSNASAARRNADLQLQQLNLLRRHQGLPPLLPPPPTGGFRKFDEALLATLCWIVLRVAAPAAAAVGVWYLLEPSWVVNVGAAVTTLVLLDRPWKILRFGINAPVRRREREWADYWSTHYYGVDG